MCSRKTCANFNPSTGTGCRFGDKCRFLHTRNHTEGILGKKGQRPVCIYFDPNTGAGCKNGDACPFTHMEVNGTTRSNPFLLEATSNSVRKEQSLDAKIFLVGAKMVGKSTLASFLHKLIYLTQSYFESKNIATRKLIYAIVACEDLPATTSVNDLIIYMFDISNNQSFEYLKKKLPEIKETACASRYLVGNKVDFEYWRRVPLCEARECSESMCSMYHEISVHSGYNLALISSIALFALYGDVGLDFDKLIYDLAVDCNLAAPLPPVPAVRPPAVAIERQETEEIEEIGSGSSLQSGSSDESSRFSDMEEDLWDYEDDKDEVVQSDELFGGFDISDTGEGGGGAEAGAAGRAPRALLQPTTNAFVHYPCPAPPPSIDLNINILSSSPVPVSPGPPLAPLAFPVAPSPSLAPPPHPPRAYVNSLAAAPAGPQDRTSAAGVTNTFADSPSIPTSRPPMPKTAMHERKSEREEQHVIKRKQRSVPIPAMKEKFASRLSEASMGKERNSSMTAAPISKRGAKDAVAASSERFKQAAAADDDDDADLADIMRSVSELKVIGASINEELQNQGTMLETISGAPTNEWGGIDYDAPSAKVPSKPSAGSAATRQAVAYMDDEEDIIIDEELEENDLTIDDHLRELRDIESQMDGKTSDGINAKEASVKNVMLQNIDETLERGDRIDNLEEMSGSLEPQSAQFYQSSARLKRRNRCKNCLFTTCCCPCIGVAYIGQGCFFCISACCRKISEQISIIRAKIAIKNKLFDNVLADTENAFQTLAKFLCYLHKECCEEGCGHYVYMALLKPFVYAVSLSVIVSSSLSIILPSFFTLLIVRTTTTEKESTNFGVRQEVIRHEKPEQSFKRWLRIIIRSAPMTFFLLIAPYLLVYRVFPLSSNQEIVSWLFAYIAAVILLQILGTVRAYYSWKDRDSTLPPKPPSLYEEKGQQGKNKDDKSNEILKEKNKSSSKKNNSSSSSTAGNSGKMLILTNASGGDIHDGNGLELKVIVGQAKNAFNSEYAGSVSPSKRLRLQDSDSSEDEDEDEETMAPKQQKGGADLFSSNHLTRSYTEDSRFENPSRSLVFSQRKGCCTRCCPGFVARLFRSCKCCSCCCSTPEDEEKEEPAKPAPIPAVPNSFNLKTPSNLLVIGSLLLEFFQMASFPLQNNPYNKENPSPTFAPTQAPNGSIIITDGVQVNNFWGEAMFKTLYVSVAPNSQFIIMWGAVGAVVLLLLIFAGQFFIELLHYGKLLRHVEDKDEAKDSFFFSFTGAIVYGHGNPKNVSNNFRTVVALMTDGLFLVISLRLLTVLSCDYRDSPPTLYVDPSIVCWEGEHMPLAAAALTCYAFYVPLSIMIAPMLLEAAPTDGDQPLKEGVSYMKLYVMLINIVKSIMLLVGTLGPHTVVAVVTSTTVTSIFLGLLTLIWFIKASKKKDEQNGVASTWFYVDDVQPCNKAFINSWKAASYAAAVSSALVIVSAHEMGESNFPQSSLIPVLCIVWAVIVLIFAALHMWWVRSNTDRYLNTEALVTMPFVWRDAKERLSSQGLDPDLAFANPDSTPLVAESIRKAELVKRISPTTKGSQYQDILNNERIEQMVSVYKTDFLHAAKEAAKQFYPTSTHIPTCNNDHIMISGLYNNNTCDRCKKLLPCTYRCAKCDWDLCFNCSTVVIYDAKREADSREHMDSSASTSSAAALAAVSASSHLSPQEQALRAKGLQDAAVVSTLMLRYWSTIHMDDPRRAMIKIGTGTVLTTVNE